MDYTDLATGRVLYVEPGGTYDIQAAGFNAPDIPVNNFVRAEPVKKKRKEESSSAPEVEE
jgi:hypothetical protein